MDRAHEAAPRCILSGGTIVTPDAVIEGGSVVIEDGRIVAVTPHFYPTSTTPHEIVTHLSGQFVLPGLVCLHNDAVEKAINPRPFANLPAPLALLTLDRSLAMAGVTTQFHAISFNDLPGKERTVAGTAAMHDALVAFGASGAALIDHHVLYRCDVRLAASLDAILARLPQASARLVSFNDHAPGQGQLRDLRKTAERLAPDLTGMSAAEWLTEREAFARTSEGQIAQTYAALRDATREYSITLMSHDDDSAEKVDAMHALGCRIAEFPVTTEAARHARERGMYISMGAPNAVRGGSISGNASTLELAHRELVDILVADYHAPSLLYAAWLLVNANVLSLPRAVAMLTATPAAAVGLTDRGALTPGMRADIIIVERGGAVPSVTQMYIRGERRFIVETPVTQAMFTGINEQDRYMTRQQM